jgi:putative ABC transport system permease protein
MSWLRRISNAFRSRRVQHDIDRELSFHLAERTDHLREQGVAPEEARRRARVQFGNPIVQRERTLDIDITRGVDTVSRNIRYAVRSLLRTPGFTAIVMLTLALGIGANSAVFSAMNAVLLRPLPFPDAERLMRLSQTTELRGQTDVAAVRLVDWNRLSSTFEAITGYVIEDVSDTIGDQPERVQRARVTPRFLQVWGIAPALGRTFTDAEHLLGGPSAVLISDRYWRRRFSADPKVLEKSVRMGERPYSIVGVLPPSFEFPERDVDWWVPEFVNAPWMAREYSAFVGLGRLKPGITLEQARADLALVQTQLAEQHPKTDRDIRPLIAPLKEAVVANARGSLWLVFGSVSVLLLIACTNIAALLLSRATRRRHEIAVRYSLGASRAAVAGQVLTEGAVLALAGAVAGVLVAVAASSWLATLAPDIPRLEDARIDARVLLYTMGTAVLAAMLCTLAPAVRSMRGSLITSGATRTHVSTRHSLQWLLVGVQVALSVTLLTGAGLLVRSFDKLSRVDPGFDPTRVLTFRVSASFGEERDYNRTVQRINRTIDALTALPGVEAVATTTQLPGIPGQFETEFTLVEGRAATEPRMFAESRIVSVRYFDALDIPLLAGERCRPTLDGGVTEVLINKSFADRYLPGRSAIGLHFAGGSPGRIVGLVQDARERGTDRSPVPTVYSCFSAPTPFPWFLVRTTADPMTIVNAVRAKSFELEPLRSVFDIAALDERIDEAYAQNRLRTLVLVLFAATALSLAALGVYGTLSYLVGLRRREIALRLALGALRTSVVQQLIGTSVRIVGIASAVGVALALIVTQGLTTMLYGVTPTDPVTLAGVVVMVVTVAGVAAVVPAARAAFVQPMRALRED